AAFTLVATARRGALGLRGVLLGGHFWLSFAGAALGLRFFKGYYLQVLPAAVWIAAHPDGAIVRWLRRAPFAAGSRLRSGLLIACIALALVPGLISDVGELRAIHKTRRHARDPDAQRIGKVIAANTTADEPIWVWGRWAWPVYFHADRRASGPFYKVLGVLTNNLTNTWRRPTEPTRFLPDSPWREVMDALQAAPPAFIAVSRNEDYSKFAAFNTLLRQDYERVNGLPARQMLLYKRKGRPWIEPVRPQRKTGTRSAKRKPKGEASQRKASSSTPAADAARKAAP
ncbi:MAG: hypothetical protein KC620_21450, partial [Myxococcales bacterium]|nr:hypothetical protein [Myxococcales bacterium]